MNSMTGYGKYTLEKDGREVTIELKSVNHRFLDLSFKIPHSLLYLEEDLRKTISGRLARGHVDVFATYRNKRSDARRVEVDTSLADAYRSAWLSMNEMGIGGEPEARDIIAMPDVITVREAEDDEDALRALVTECCDKCLDAIGKMREAEGGRLKSDIENSVNDIERITLEIEQRRPQMIEEYRARLIKTIRDLEGSIADPARLSMEIAIMIDRSAIDEETVRLHSHIEAAREILASTGPAGRKLDFLAQEFNREANTISSKSQDIPITRSVMAMKNVIEKLREQVQNVE